MATPPLPAATADAPIRVLFCCDPGYYQHLAVALVSLAESNARHALDIHLITSRRDLTLEQKLLASLAAAPRARLQIHLFTPADTSRWHTSHHITTFAYTRLFAAEVLPSHIDRILYLDVDLLVLDDLAPLWRFELGEAALAAAVEPLGAPRIAALGLPPDAPYVNSGVLLIDLATWRGETLSRRFAAYIETQGPLLECHDQDTINAVLAGRIAILDLRWNLHTKLLRPPRAAVIPDKAALAQARRRPAILHYASARKPWLFVIPTPRKGLYWRYLKRTAWRGARPADRSWSKIPERLVNYALYWLGFDYTWERVLRRTTFGRIVARSGALLSRGRPAG